MTDHDLREWEVAPSTAVGGMPAVVWALIPHDEPEIIAMAMTHQCAQQIVGEHHLVTTPYHDDEHRGGSWLELLTGMQAEIARLQRLLEQNAISYDQDSKEA